jgi:hypothetical protein
VFAFSEPGIPGAFSRWKLRCESYTLGGILGSIPQLI